MLVAGTLVSLSGLVAKPELEGVRGEVLSFDDRSSRYIVRVDASEEPVRVLAKNLRLLDAVRRRSGGVL